MCVCRSDGGINYEGYPNAYIERIKCRPSTSKTYSLNHDCVVSVQPLAEDPWGDRNLRASLIAVLISRADFVAP